MPSPAIHESHTLARRSVDIASTRSSFHGAGSFDASSREETALGAGRGVEVGVSHFVIVAASPRI
jgi:hypothetical protein